MTEYKVVRTINEAAVVIRQTEEGAEASQDTLATFHGPKAQEAAEHYCHVMNNPCLAKLAVGEPFFVLRGQDRLAVIVVQGWAILAAQNGVSFAKVLEAQQKARAIEEWPKKKIPD